MKKNTKIRPARMELDQRSFIRARGETQQDVFNRVTNDLRRFGFFKRTDLVKAIAQHPKLPRELVPIYNSELEFHAVKLKQHHIHKENYSSWLLGMFSAHADLLKGFITARTLINGAILRGSGADALAELNKLSLVSQSWWAIEIGIHVNKSLMDLETANQINDLLNIYPNLNISIRTRDLLLLSQSTSPSFYIDTLLGRIREYKSVDSSDVKEFGALESLTSLPPTYDPDRVPVLHAMHHYMSWSLFDQYMLFRSILMENDSPKAQLGADFDFVIQLIETIGDYELRNVIVPNLESDATITEIVSDYTKGKYRDVLQKVRNLVLSDSPRVYALIEVYARSKLYEGDVTTTETFFDKLANEFALILALDSKSKDRTIYLQSIAIQFRKEGWAKSLLYHLLVIQEYRIEDRIIESARRQTFCLGSFNTPKARNSRSNAVLENDVVGVPGHRILRHSNELQSSLSPGIFPIYSDYLKTQSRAVLQAPTIFPAVQFCITEYLKNRVAFDHLPFSKVREWIQRAERDSAFDYVAAMIILDIYSRESESAFGELQSELFQEFLLLNKEHQPSKIFALPHVSEQTAYFLRYVCVPSQLDNVIEFETYDDVIHERVAIIDLLLSAKIKGIEELRSERDKVLETLFSEKLRAKLEAGKLYVDVQALEANRRLSYVDMYEKAKSYGEELTWPSSESENNPQGSESSDSRTDSISSKGAGDKSTILAMIYLQLAFDFALDEKFGLDKYLSAEVRHVVFVPQLRACFEKNYLMTSQKSGKYLPNEHWIEFYNFIPDAILNKLDFILADFSAAVDVALSEVNNKFMVSVTDSNEKSLFDFSHTPERAERLAIIIKRSKSFDDFFRDAIGLMWELAVEGARRAQQLIHDTLMETILNAVDILETAVQTEKGHVQMFDLTQSIKNARSDFKHEVEIVLNWFRFVGSDTLQSFEELGVVIEAAVSSFRSIYEHKGRTLTFLPSRSSLVLSYREARSLFISLYTALENALRYSRAETEVVLRHIVQENQDTITITNEMSVRVVDPDDFVQARRAEWKNEDYSRLSIEEGGTGLYKIYGLLLNSSSGFSFDISIDEKHMFTAAIGLAHDDFDNRRQST